MPIIVRKVCYIADQHLQVEPADSACNHEDKGQKPLDVLSYGEECALFVV
jgi:hypothetical protein